MLINKKLIGLTKIANKEKWRAAINSIQITNDYAVATDGYKLLKIELSKELKATDFPDRKSKSIEKEVLIPVDIFEKTLKKIQRNKNIPILNNALVVEGDSDDTIKIVTTDLDTTITTTFNKVDGEFPEWEKIIPIKKPKASIRIEIKYLQDVLEAMQIAGSTYVDIDTRGELEALELKGETSENDSIYGLVMPIRKV